MSNKPGMFEDWPKAAKWVFIIAVCGLVLWYVGGGVLGLAGMILAGGF